MVQQQSLTLEKQAQTTCRHHWLIEAPNGPTGRGICRLCGEEREFKNYIETVPWSESSPVAGAVAGSKALNDGAEDEFD